MNILTSIGLEIFDILLIVIFVILLIAFLRDFKLTNPRSWIMLLGFTAVGGIFMFQRWRRRQLLKQFEEREKSLKELEREYEKQKQKGKITEEAYLNAKEKLEQAKVNEAIALMNADERLTQIREEIEREFKNMSTEELLARFKEAVK